MIAAVRLALVANSDSGASDHARHVAAHLRAAGADVLEPSFARVCEAPEAVAEELAGVDRIVVAGGDGSVGPAARLAARAALQLAVVPVGTANSFARWLGLPDDPEAACALAADPDAATRRVEVADAAGRPFVNVAATGLSVLAAHRARPLKRRLGPLAYAVGAARAGLTGRPLHCRVRCDGAEAWSGDAWQVLVAATGAFGGDASTGGVDPADEQLDVAIVEAGPRWALVRRAWAMQRGRLVHDDGVRHVRGAVVEVEVDGHPSFNVDGEVLGVDPPRFSVTGTVDVVVGR